MNLKTALSVAAMLGVPWSDLVAADPVHLNISGAFNYDAVGTQAEVSTNVPTYSSYLSGAIGDHGLQYGTRCYTDQASVSSGTALPNSGVLGGYAIPTAFDNGTTRRTKQNNSVALITSNAVTQVTKIIAIPAGQQAPYASINMLFVSMRDANSSSYRSTMIAHYTDDTNEIVLDTGLGGGSGPGGTFGGAAAGGNGGYPNTVDNYIITNQAPNYAGAVIPHRAVLVMNRGCSQSGSSQSIRDQTCSLWEFAQPIALDGARSLASLEITLRRSGVNRNQSLWVVAINAYPSIPPGTVLCVK